MFRIIFTLIILTLVLIWPTVQAQEENQDQCRIDFVAVIYGSPLGEKSIEIKGAEAALKQATKLIANELIKQIVKKASNILDMAGNLSTSRFAHHVNIIYAYRFIHKGKPTSEWQLHSQNKLLSQAGTDYFFSLSESKEKALDRIAKLEEELNTQLESQCEEHNNP